MKVEDLLINVARPKTIVNELNKFISLKKVKKALEDKDYSLLAKYLQNTSEASSDDEPYTPIGLQASGLLWAILRDIEKEDLLPGLDYLPENYYAYNRFQYPPSFITDKIKKISRAAFYRSDLDTISLPNTLTSVDDIAFATDKPSLLIIFDGTKKEWRSIKKSGTIWGDKFSGGPSHRVIRCNDGDIER